MYWPIILGYIIYRLKANMSVLYFMKECCKYKPIVQANPTEICMRDCVPLETYTLPIVFQNLDLAVSSRAYLLLQQTLQ